MTDTSGFWELLTAWGWFPLAWAVVPVAAAALVLWLARTQPFLRAVPAATAVALFLVLVVVSALDTPGGDLLTPLLGVVVSAAACAVVFVRLRRQPIAAGR